MLEPLPGAVEEADEFLKKKPETLERFEKVERLIDGFETAFGMELLGSVDWVAKYENQPAKSLEQAVRLVHCWSERKRQSFAPAHVEAAWKRLTDQGWLR